MHASEALEESLRQAMFSGESLDVFQQYLEELELQEVAIDDQRTYDAVLKAALQEQGQDVLVRYQAREAFQEVLIDSGYIVGLVASQLRKYQIYIEEAAKKNPGSGAK